MTEGAYTNKAPGGVAYRCSFRVTEASYLIERLVQNAAYELGIDPAELRMRNFIQPEQFPYTSATGFVYDSGDYPAPCAWRWTMVGYEDLRREQAEPRQGAADRHRPRPASPRWSGPGRARSTTSPGSRCSTPPSCGSTRPARRSSSSACRARARATRRPSPRSWPRSWASPPRTSWCRRATPTTRRTGSAPTPRARRRWAGAATAMVSRKLRDKAKEIAAHLLEAAEEDLELENGEVLRQGLARPGRHHPGRRARRLHQPPRRAWRPGLEGVHYYDPPNMTYPFGSYVVVVEVDAETGQWKVRRMVAVDDCGVRINPMIVEGQIHGGLAEGFAMAATSGSPSTRRATASGPNFLDYLIPTAWETPRFELGETVTPSPHHPIGAKGVGESATVGSPAAYVNAVIDALAHLGVRNIDMPVLPHRVWGALKGPR